MYFINVIQSSSFGVLDLFLFNFMLEVRFVSNFRARNRSPSAGSDKEKKKIKEKEKEKDKKKKNDSGSSSSDSSGRSIIFLLWLIPSLNYTSSCHIALSFGDYCSNLRIENIALYVLIYYFNTIFINYNFFPYLKNSNFSFQ